MCNESEGVVYRPMPSELHEDVIELLNHHRNFSIIGVEYTERYGHGRFQQDTKSWTELIGSVLAQINGHGGNVPPGGGDLEDGSDVKGFNALNANDSPRWNGVIHVGHQRVRESNDDGSYSEDTAYSPDEFDSMPYLFLCAWHEIEGTSTFSTWVIRGNDTAFRQMIDGIAIIFNDGNITGNIQFFGPSNSRIGSSRNYRIHENLNIVFSNDYYLQMPLLFRAQVQNDGAYSMEECIWRPEAAGENCILLVRPDDDVLPPNCTSLLTAMEAAGQIGISISEFRERYSRSPSHVSTHYWRADLLGL